MKLWRFQVPNLLGYGMLRPRQVFVEVLEEEKHIKDASGDSPIKDPKAYLRLESYPLL